MASAQAVNQPSKPNTGGQTSQGSQQGTGTQPTAPTGAGAGSAADEACKKAISLALTHPSLAVNHYSNCDGPTKAAARSAIDSGARRAVATKGCAAKGDAQAAAKIGAGGAMSDLQKKKCR